jgi:sodium transport system ATP-binding protein
MIIARHLTKIFHDQKRGSICALDDVSFSCHPGKIFGLLGINGAGKTTCLRLLATLLHPSSGTATVAGYDVTTAAECVRANIGFLSSATALYDRLTAREMVEYFGRLQGMDEALLQKRLDELFAVLDMNEIRDRRCSKLSTGMKQKVSIARTLVHDPQVMIFDEPTLGLDVLTARNVLEFIRQCGQRGKTVIFSTHVMSEVEKLCDTVAMIHQGKFLGEGTLSEWRERTGERVLEDIFVKVVEAPR